MNVNLVVAAEKIYNEIMKEGKNYNYFGMRKCNENYKKNQYCRRSYEIIDGEKTSKKLNGTCTVDVTPIQGANKKENIDNILKSLKEVVTYSGKKIYLIAGTDGESGEDYKEIIISNIQGLTRRGGKVICDITPYISEQKQAKEEE